MVERLSVPDARGPEAKREPDVRSHRRRGNLAVAMRLIHDQALRLEVIAHQPDRRPDAPMPRPRRSSDHAPYRDVFRQVRRDYSRLRELTAPPRNAMTNAESMVRAATEWHLLLPQDHDRDRWMQQVAEQVLAYTTGTTARTSPAAKRYPADRRLEDDARAVLARWARRLDAYEEADLLLDDGELAVLLEHLVTTRNLPAVYSVARWLVDQDHGGSVRARAATATGADLKALRAGLATLAADLEELP